LILIGAGVGASFRLNQELLPNVEFPGVYILTADPGAGPEVVDREVTLPLAATLTGLPRVRHINTQSSQGFSLVAIQFDLDSSLKDDLDNVNQRLGQFNQPPGVAKPLVESFSFSAFPTITYSLVATDGDLARATREAKDVIAPALQGAKGLAQVKVVGGEQDSVLASLDLTRLEATGIPVGQVEQALAGAQVNLPAGEALDGAKSVPVEVRGDVKTVDDLKKLPVGVAQAPNRPPLPVTLGDVATVTRGATPVNGISRTDGHPSLQIQVIRNQQDNAVTLSNDVRSRIARLHLDPNDRLELIEDSATDIKASLNDLLLEGLLGALLAIIVIWLFLGSLRATLVTAVSLPTSVLVALLGTNLWGFSLNILTLAGLTIAVGRIVDDAIVVLENSYRHLQRGESARDAAFQGAVEVARPVISSTLTTVAVFLPIGFVGGIISKFFLPFSLTVTISLLASLLVALTIVPVLVSLFLERHSHTRGTDKPSRLSAAYLPVLRWALSRGWHRAAVILTALVLLGGSLAVGLIGVPKNFFAFGSSDQLTGQVMLPAGTSAEQTSEQVKQFEEAARADPDVKLVGVTVANSDYGGFTAGFSSNQARFTIITKTRSVSPAVANRLQRKLDELYGPGHGQITVATFGPPSNLFTVNISGIDENALRQASDQIVAELQRDSDLTNVKTNLAPEKPELLITVDPARAALHGTSPRQVAMALSQVLGVQPVGSLGPGGPTVRVQVNPRDITVERLSNLSLDPGVTLKDVAQVSRVNAPVAINRQDGVRQVTVSANISGSDVSGASSRATARVQKLRLPAGVKLDTGGTSQDINDSFISMFQAIAVAIGIVFVILVAFFRSVVTPFVILLTMPLALIGAMLALFVTRQPLGLPALLGILMVFGIVVSNAILLVDFAERAMRRQTVLEALETAGRIRLRPILMTAVATIVALLPVAVGVSTSGGGGLISQGLAVVVEGGLISSTFLTLIVIPVAYAMLRPRGRTAAPVPIAASRRTWEETEEEREPIGA
jgi:HAE1 family hydrophobic/amphiphilic exporter-1